MSAIGRVAAFLFTRADSDTDVLIGVRRASTNPRHPGVVSIPTLRIPEAIYVPLKESLPKTGVKAASNLAECPDIALFGASGAGAGLASFVTESVISKKLELSSELEAGQVQGSCAPWLHLEMLVDDPLGTNLSEYTSMVTVVGRWDKGADLARRSTESYESLTWIDGRQLVRAWDKRDAQMLYPDRDPMTLCISGLCMRSAVEIIRRADGGLQT